LFRGVKAVGVPLHGVWKWSGGAAQGGDFEPFLNFGWLKMSSARHKCGILAWGIDMIVLNNSCNN
jgi:hypothetical protein